MKIAVLISLTIIVFSGCEKEDPDAQSSLPDFDRSALLTDLASLIHESYQEHTASLSDMHEGIEQFISSPTPTSLALMREKWSTALLKWQHVAPYQFGLASDLAMESSSNIYPAEVARIEDNISLGSYNLDAAVNLTAIGFQAIDYLIYGLSASDSDLINHYSTASDSAARGQYLLALSQQLMDRSNAVAQTWMPNAAERVAFIENDGTDQGSSLGLFLNAFNKSFEKTTRTQKLGVPSGALTFSMTPNPTTVEAYYEYDNSLAYLEESINAFETIYLGASEESISFDDYLITLDARHGDLSLDEAIKNQISQVRTAISSLQNPLAETVVNNQEAALDAFAELQALVVLWKVDMMSSLSILITYQDTDGD